MTTTRTTTITEIGKYRWPLAPICVRHAQCEMSVVEWVFGGLVGGLEVGKTVWGAVYSLKIAKKQVLGLAMQVKESRVFDLMRGSCVVWEVAKLCHPVPRGSQTGASGCTQVGIN